MFIKEELIGKPYPVKDFDGNVVGSRPIHKVYDVSNYAGIALQFEGSDTLLMISYSEVAKLLEK